MHMPTTGTAKATALAIALFAVLASAKGAASPLRGEFSFKGHHFVIGSGAAETRAIQGMTGPNVVYWPAHGALFAADPALNGVMVYDETKAGATVRPYGILSGPNTTLNGPVAVATGSDLPCYSSVCTPYLWVANAGSQAITYYTLPLTSWNQAPSGTISWNGNSTCSGVNANPGSSSPLQFPYGIVHYYFPYSIYGNPQGQLIQTSEANSGGYWINAWDATDNGPTQCVESYTDSTLDSPSGPSVYNASGNLFVFNANQTLVTATYYSGLHWGGFLPWSPGPAACTEGTAVEAGSASSNTFVWVTTNAGCKYPKTDALWSCSPSTGFMNGCPVPPVCKNPTARLDFPGFPAVSPTTNRLYVPNQNNGTVTAYTLNGSGSATCRPKSVYINLQAPLGVAVQD
jgi:hypothetical protein